MENYSSDCYHWLKTQSFYTPTTKCGGGVYTWFALSRQSVRLSVRPSPIRVRSKTPLLMEGFPSNLNDTFISTVGGYTGFALSRRSVGCVGRSVGRSVGPSVSNSCPLYNSFTNGRISFKLEWHIHLN